MKELLLSAFALICMSCQKQKDSLKIKETQTHLTESINLNTLQISPEIKGYEKDTINVSFVQTSFGFIDEKERKEAETFVQKSIEKNEGPMQLFSNFSIKQSSKIIKNEKNILGLLVEQSENGEKKYFTRYYEVDTNKQLNASDIFAPKEKFQQLSEYIKSKNPTIVDANIEATDENYKAIEFDKDGNLTIYFENLAPVHLTGAEVAMFSHRRFRDAFRLPPTIDCGKVPCVALTFDDGPGVYTPKLLDILKENDAKATFFVLGTMVEHYPEILKRTYEEGHQIGNHSWNHKDLKRLTADGVEFQVVKTNEKIKQVIGQDPTVFRPPYGSYNPSVAQIINMPIILWDIDPLDWKDKNANSVAQKIAKAQRNSIILAHDIHKSTVDAIPMAIKELKAKGFHFVTIEDLFYGIEMKKSETYNKRNH